MKKLAIILTITLLTPSYILSHDSNCSEIGDETDFATDLIQQEDLKNRFDALLDACERNDFAAVEFMLSQEPTLIEGPQEQYGPFKTALIYACSHCTPEMVEFLIKHNAQINAQDDSGYTALWHAFARLLDGTILTGNPIDPKVRKVVIRIITILLNNKADTQLRDKDNLTILDWAKLSHTFVESEPEIVSLLAQSR